MKRNDSYVNSFKYGLLFGKRVKPGDNAEMSVCNVDDVVLAVRLAYIDMSPRTLKSDGEKKIISPDEKQKMFKWLAKEIANYIKNGANNFDQWHNKLCEEFIKEFEQLLKNANKNTEAATYGKAQKIINMTFKYLYCFDDAEQYVERFVPCHMALDSYILDWVYDNIEIGGKKLTRKQLPKWSNLKYEQDQESNILQYKEIQDAIKAYLEKDMPGVPRIEAEFLIWYEQRAKKDTSDL